MVEFRVPPTEPDDFARILDETLAAVNTDYRSKRQGDVAMVAPDVTALPPGTFSRWMRQAGKFGHYQTVPRVSNDRALAEALVAAAGEGARALVMAVD